MSYASTDEPERSDGVAPPAPILVVGIGASSGGLEALRSLCSALPSQTGLAFVIIQHLDDSAPNLLPGLLSNLCGMPTEEASDGMTLAADHIYVAPPHSIARLHQGVLEVVK